MTEGNLQDVLAEILVANYFLAISLNIANVSDNLIESHELKDAREYLVNRTFPI